MRCFLVFVVLLLTAPAVHAEPVVLAPMNFNAYAGLSDVEFRATIEQLESRCDYDVKRTVVTAGGRPIQDQITLYRSCLRASGIAVYSPAQFRSAADAWNAANPKNKARGWRIGD